MNDRLARRVAATGCIGDGALVLPWVILRKIWEEVHREPVHTLDVRLGGTS